MVVATCEEHIKYLKLFYKIDEIHCGDGGVKDFSVHLLQLILFARVDFVDCWGVLISMWVRDKTHTILMCQSYISIEAENSSRIMWYACDSIQRNSIERAFPPYFCGHSFIDISRTIQKESFFFCFHTINLLSHALDLRLAFNISPYRGHCRGKSMKKCDINILAINPVGNFLFFKNFEIFYLKLCHFMFEILHNVY